MRPAPLSGSLWLSMPGGRRWAAVGDAGMSQSEIDPHDETMMASAAAHTTGGAAPSAPAHTTGEASAAVPSAPVNTMGGVSAPLPRRGLPLWALVLVLSLAAVAAAVLVFVVLSAVGDTPAPANAALAPTAGSDEALPVGEALPAEEAATQSTLRVVAPSIEGARIFIDAVDRGPLQPEMTFDLAPGPHSVEARRDDRIVAHTPVELEAGASTEVTLDETRAARIETTRHSRSRGTAARRHAPSPGEPTGQAAEAPSEDGPTEPVAEATAMPEPTEPVAETSRRVARAEPRGEGSAMSAMVAAAPVAPDPPVQPATMAPIQAATMNEATTAPPPLMAPQAPVRPAAATLLSVRSELEDLRPAVQRCVGPWHGAFEVAATIRGGRVGVRVGRGPSGQQRRCVQRALVEQLRRRFPAGVVSVRHTYRL